MRERERAREEEGEEGRSPSDSTAFIVSSLLGLIRQEREAPHESWKVPTTLY